MTQLITIDSEFKSLIPPLTEDERSQLEANIQSEGCRDALVIWKGHDTLIDGHNRYEICTRLNVPYQTVEREFESKQDVIVWIVQNQLGRRNIASFVRAELALRMKDAVAVKAKENQAHGLTAPGKTLPQNFAEPIETRQKLAKVAEVSHETIRKVETVTKKAPESIKAKARSGELSTHRAYQLTKSLEGAATSVIETVTKYDVEDVETINILKRLHKNNSETMQEILASGHVQPGDEQESVHITEGALKVQKALDLKAKTHKHLGIENKRRELAEQGSKREVGDMLIHADFRQYMAAMPENSVDLIFTDPPYFEEFIPLYGDLARLAARVLKPGGSLIAYAGHYALPQIFGLMSPHLRYWWMLGVRHGNRFSSLAGKKTYVTYKPMVWYVKEHLTTDNFVMDMVDSEHPPKNLHDWAQSQIEAAYYINALSKPGDTVLDPFAGSGTTLIAALRLERKAIGIEKDEQAYNIARGSIFESLNAA